MRNVVVHYATNPPEIGRRMSTRSEEIAFMYSNIWIIDFLSKKFVKNHIAHLQFASAIYKKVAR